MHPDLLARLSLMADGVRLPPAAAADRVQEVAALRATEAVAARVERQLGGAEFQLNAGGRLFRMKLPEGTRPGDLVRLVLVDGTPRLLLPASEAGGMRPDAVSSTGRLLASLAQSESAGMPPPARQQTAPLLANAHEATGEIPARLQEALTQSGLFYESHLAQWVAGERALAQLLREPQARLPRQPAEPPAEPLQTGNTRESGPATAPPTGREPLPAPAHPDTFALIRQQIDILETGQLHWQGQAWPGQWLEWEISEGDQETGASETTSTWRTRLTLTLPGLGHLNARIVLSPTGAQLVVETDSQDSAERLRAHDHELLERLGTAGIGTAVVSVNPHAPA